MRVYLLRGHADVNQEQCCSG